MKDLRSLQNLLAVLLILSSMVGCGALQGRPQSHPSSTSLVASDSSLDFGTVVVGNNAVRIDYISNPTNSSVTISRVVASGGDFELMQPTLPVTISPGQRTMFVINFTPQNTGTLNGTIAISSSAQQPAMTLSVSGRAVAAGRLVPNPSSINFGSVNMGSSQMRTGSFTNGGSSAVTISQAASSMGDFSVGGMTLPVTLMPGQSANFRVSFTPKANGQRGGNITVIASSSLWAPGDSSQGRRRRRQGATSQNVNLNIPVSGVGNKPSSTSTELGQLTAPGSLSFGSFVSGGASQSKPLVLTNSGTASVTITQAAATGAGYTLSGPGLPLTLDAGGTANFSVTFAPQSVGAANGNVTIQSTAANSSLNVGLTATVNSAGKLTVSANPLAFGTISVGKTMSKTATITNSGGTSVTVSQATVTGTAFSVTGITMPMTLSPNQSANLSVSCAPKSAGAVSGNLNVASDAGTVAVPLSATAVLPGDLILSAASLSFGNVQVGKTQSLPETVTNSGGSSITLSQAAAGAGFTINGLTLPMSLAPGSSASFNVVFAPQSAVSSNVNLALINDGPTPTLTIPLSGAGISDGSITVSPVSFGSVQVGTTSTRTATLTNPGGSSVTISQANLTGGAFGMTGLSTPLTLNAGQSFTFSVTFTPAAAGSASGSIGLVSNGTGTDPSISLTGTGAAAGQFLVSPGSFAFGSVAVGASKSMRVTLSATGASVTVTAASVNSAEFDLTGPSLPLTIQPGTTASFNLTFSPQSSGAATAHVSFTTNATSSPVSEAITGTGAAAAQHSVDLAWSPSSSPVAGYNVYRGTTTGGPYAKLNSSVNAGLSFTDTSVQAGQTYFYTTTAVASNGSESTHSNEVQAVIPTP